MGDADKSLSEGHRSAANRLSKRWSGLKPSQSAFLGQSRPCMTEWQESLDSLSLAVPYNANKRLLIARDLAGSPVLEQGPWHLHSNSMALQRQTLNNIGFLWCRASQHGLRCGSRPGHEGRARGVAALLTHTSRLVTLVDSPRPTGAVLRHRQADSQAAGEQAPSQHR